jgi:hypothetical protein
MQILAARARTSLLSNMYFLCVSALKRVCVCAYPCVCAGSFASLLRGGGVLNDVGACQAACSTAHVSLVLTECCFVHVGCVCMCV